MHNYADTVNGAACASIRPEAPKVKSAWSYRIPGLGHFLYELGGPGYRPIGRRRGCANAEHRVAGLLRDQPTDNTRVLIQSSAHGLSVRPLTALGMDIGRC